MFCNSKALVSSLIIANMLNHILINRLNLFSVAHLVFDDVFDNLFDLFAGLLMLAVSLASYLKLTTCCLASMVGTTPCWMTGFCSKTSWSNSLTYPSLSSGKLTVINIFSIWQKGLGKYSCLGPLLGCPLSSMSLTSWTTVLPLRSSQPALRWPLSLKHQTCLSSLLTFSLCLSTTNLHFFDTGLFNEKVRFDNEHALDRDQTSDIPAFFFKIFS